MRHELFRAGARRAFEGDLGAAERAGRWVAATMLNDEKSLAWCRDRSIIIERAQGELTGPTGGFVVPVETEAAIIDFRNLAGVFRQEARIRPMGSDALNAPRRSGGVTAYFVGENGQITESSVTWDNIAHEAKKLAALSRLSTELVEDSAADIGAWFAEEMGVAFADTEDSCGWNGDGSGTYGGITGLATKLVTNFGTANQLAGAVTAPGTGHDTFAEIDATDIAALMGALPERFWSTAKFHVSAYGAANAFVRLGATAGGSIMTISGPRPMLSYLGFPIVLNPKLPGAGDQSAKLMIGFGDLRQAVSLGDRRGLTVQASKSRYLEYDQVGIRGTERFDLVSHGIGDTTTAGPLVGLIGN